MENRMIFWHIQMFLPEGRGGTKIDSSKMLKESEPIIGTGELDNFQCRQFKNANNTGLKVGDIILVREGERVLALCKVIGDVFQDVLLTSKYLNRNFRKVHIIEWYSLYLGLCPNRPTVLTYNRS